MVFKLKSYPKFLLQSTNEHGVHSPFVFNYVTKCLYDKHIKSKDKVLDVLLKSSSYFQSKNIAVIGNNAYKEALKKQGENFPSDTSKIDLLFYNTPENVDSFNTFLNYKLGNNSFIVFNNIYRSPSEHNYWNNFIKSDKVTVSIDLFHCGVIFIRKEQEKEHFTIRI